MPLSAHRWKQFAESRYPYEREALEFLRDVLPDRDPNFLYSNFEFIADDGSVNEIDALVVTQAGVFLVELKSRGGIVTGNRHLWDWTKEGHTITVDSPLTLANSKARKLAGLLSKQRSFRGERAPWIEALISFRLCQAVRDLLVDEGIEAAWSKRAVTEILAASSETSVARSADSVVETDAKSGRTKWWTFGGLKANASLAVMLRTKDGVVPRYDNYSIEILGPSGLAATEQLFEAAKVNGSLAESATVDLQGKIKFWECLPHGLRAQLIRLRFTDIASAMKLLSEPRAYIDDETS